MVLLDATESVQGEGRAALASKDVMLGEQLPPLTLLMKDALGNAVPLQEVPAGLSFSLKAAPVSGQAAELEWEAAEVDVLPSAKLVGSPSSAYPFQLFINRITSSTAFAPVVSSPTLASRSSTT